MKIEFSDTKDFTSNATDCQVFIALSGTRNYILERLEELIGETYRDKPIQGVVMHSRGTQEVMTPIWEGKPY